MNKTYQFSLDHFGIVASPLIHQLITQTNNRRVRKSAFNALVKMAKATKQIVANEDVKHAGLTVDNAGQIWLTFSSVVVSPTVLAATPKQTKQQEQSQDQQPTECTHIAHDPKCYNCARKAARSLMLQLNPPQHQEEGVE